MAWIKRDSSNNEDDFTVSGNLSVDGTLTVSPNSFVDTWDFDQGGIHMCMSFAKDQAPSGGQGLIKIFSNNTHDEVLQGTVGLIRDISPTGRHLRIECIEQGTGYRPVIINGVDGAVGINTTTPSAAGGLSVDATLTVGLNDHDSSWASDKGGIHIGMPFAKGDAVSGGYGAIRIFSNNDITAVLQGNIALITSATAGLRRLSIDAIEQGSGYRNVTLAESGGFVGVGLTDPTNKLTVGGNADTTGINTRINGKTSTGAGAGTLTNAPSAGNPVGYLSVNINGTERFIPYW